MTRLSSVAPVAIALVLLAASTALVGCSSDDGCDLDDYTRDQGGFGLMDCGLAFDDTSAVDACAVMALRQGGTFRALYETEDGGLEAIVHTSEGVYIQVRTPADGASLEQTPCEDGILIEEDGRSYVGCFEPGEAELVCE
ncbi:MAG: hypothetical protein OXT09_12090 [Myxococcales bacterium]|nr:hypothetical protein [Myxococcales bacterium]